MNELVAIDDSTHSGFTQSALEQIISAASVPPERVLADAAARGIKIEGSTTAEQLLSLRRLPPERLDALADSYIRSCARMAAGQGFAMGLGGFVTMPVTVPTGLAASTALLARVTSATRYAYGFGFETEEARQEFYLGMLAALGVKHITTSSGRVLVEAASQMLLLEVAKRGAGVYAVNLVTHEVVPLTLRAALTQLAARTLLSPRAIPVAGGVVGSASSGLMLRKMGRRAKRHYRDLLVEWRANEGLTA